jgi:FKBP-type peptidyl-prolyl cis-trans isomerase SlyD
MIIENKTVVTLRYRLTMDENGSEIQVEQTDPQHPLVFLYGAQNVLPAFEQNLAGKSIGDPFDFYLSPEEAYGVSDPRNLTEVPTNVFKNPEGNIDESLLVIGRVISMSDESGRRFQGIIKEVRAENVLMDFNHPLADKQLHFTGEVEAVRIATPEELQHGHVHGTGGHQH